MIEPLNVSGQPPARGKFGQTLRAVAPSTPRPFWSVIVPIYERTKYLAQCLESILSQGGRANELEILVQDDCSSADFSGLVSSLSNGRATYRRNASRRGLYGNVNEALAHTSGQWIHILHEDDFVEPGFYDMFRRVLEGRPAEVGMACCQYTNLHEAEGTLWSPPPFRHGPGLLENWIDRLAVQNPLNVPAVVYRRSVFETIGLFREDLPYTGDWEYYIRSAVWFKWWYQPDDLARFRVHAENHTNALASQGRTAADLRQTIETMETYLPDDVKRSALPAARQLHGRNFLVQAWNAFQARNPELGLILMRECLRLGGPVPESVEFAQALQHPATAALRGELATRWREVDASRA